MISFVYFDLGGVLVDDFSGNQKWQALKSELGIIKDNNEVFEQIWHRYLKEICIDRDVDTLLPILRSELGLEFPNNYSLLDGFVKRFDENPILLPVIGKLSTQARLGIFTNMYPGMFEAISKRGIIPDFRWDVIVDSSIVKLQKPDSRIYTLAQEKANVPANEILFIENSPEHIDAAKKAGWQTFLYNPSDHIKSTSELQQFLSTQEFRSNE